MVKVKTQGEGRYNKSFVYSIGTVKFDEEGIAEVSEDKVEELLSVDERLSLVVKELTEEQKRALKEEKKRKEGEEILNNKINELESLSKDDLKELALAVPDVNSEIVSKMKKSELVDFLVKNV